MRSAIEEHDEQAVRLGLLEWVAFDDSVEFGGCADIDADRFPIRECRADSSCSFTLLPASLDEKTTLPLWM